MTLGYALAALAIVALGLFLWGASSLKKSRLAVERAIRQVSLDQIGPLADECRQVFRDKLGRPLDDADLEGSAAALDRFARDEATKRAFSTPELHWRFALALGAFLGELIRRHGSAAWELDPAEGPVLRVSLPGEKSLVARPFDKILRHRASGKPGQLRAYALFSAGRDPVGETGGAKGPA